MAAGDVYKMTVISTYFSQLNMNNFALEMLGASDPTQAQLHTVATDFKEIHRPSQSGRYSYTRWRAIQVRGGSVTVPGPDCTRTGGIYFEQNFTTSTSGSAIDVTDLPPQCAFVTTLKSNSIGRSRRGRLYVGGWTEGDQQGGVITASLLTTLGTSWGVFMAKYNALTGTDPNFRLAIWSERIATGCKQNPGGGHTQDRTPNPMAASVGVTSIVNRNTVYTQRRRVIGVGM